VTDADDTRRALSSETLRRTAIECLCTFRHRSVAEDVSKEAAAVVDSLVTLLAAYVREAEKCCCEPLTIQDVVCNTVQRCHHCPMHGNSAHPHKE
jgi:hypothetical protein